MSGRLAIIENVPGTMALDRRVDLIACDVVGHKVRAHYQTRSMFLDVEPTPAGWEWKWTTCDRCHAHLGGRRPETVIDREAKAITSYMDKVFRLRPATFATSITISRDTSLVSGIADALAES